jgi:transcriptional regulator with XRE-family HTH domain
MYLHNRRDLGSLIRSLRKKKGWTQEELATQLGKTRRWMMQVELGQTNADIATILRALRMLGVRLRIEDLPESNPDADITAVLLRTARGESQ